MHICGEYNIYIHTLQICIICLYGGSMCALTVLYCICHAAVIMRMCCTGSIKQNRPPTTRGDLLVHRRPTLRPTSALPAGEKRGRMLLLHWIVIHLHHTSACGPFFPALSVIRIPWLKCTECNVALELWNIQHMDGKDTIFLPLLPAAMINLYEQECFSQLSRQC